ncbi:hypothetical protein DSO57_1024521 [Entomophthora muscae]|uniref:Uncharacterized protein n=1 Tax=Entomophthora muscae TaxID=34485 RepID=A0ACC2SRS2_9FUNG|nr:hypothetical protein DSO57_1024521 [Entomophthora muscae]
MAQSLDCMYPNSKHAVEEDKYFLRHAEEYGITITHTVAGLLNDFTASSNNMTGELTDSKDKLLQAFEKNQPPSHYIIPISKLLKAASVEMDPETGGLAEDIRKNGIFLLVYIKYNPLNHRGALSFEMTVNKLKGESSRPLQTYFANPFPKFNSEGVRQPDSGLDYTVVKMNGITLQVRQVGKIGTFDLQTLLINLVAGSALLRLATFLVELLMIRFMPQREVYCKYKYHETLDFGDYRKAQRRGCEAQDMAVQKPSFHNEFPVLEYPPQENNNHYPSTSNPNVS